MTELSNGAWPFEFSGCATLPSQLRTRLLFIQVMSSEANHSRKNKPMHASLAERNVSVSNKNGEMGGTLVRKGGLGLGVGGACGGGGVTAVLPEPPFLQRKKRLGRGDLISNSRLRSAVCTEVLFWLCRGSSDGGLTQVPFLYSWYLQWTLTALWMHLDVCNECCG
ncbi:hypothetical protein DPEC_G00114100 [Dallia pectoralis]|uniref:Uncharacterized protein n=1 Tax=Dallia pectoralis TaxID=75939 RepID=A0ACC2GTW7_DALPE|nr:hypothetical protein DPEC_G00114100 [Dallia pectoralis]